LQDAALRDCSLGIEVCALAFGPDGTLWFAKENGDLGCFEGQPSQPVVRGSLGFKAELLAVAARGQVLAASKQGTDLVIWTPGKPPSLGRWNWPAPISALAISPNGRHCLLGHADGAAHYFDTRQLAS
jgi:hypothetical protein